MLEGYTKEEYISYLKELIERREDDYKIREAKAEARHNMVINQKTRTIRYLTVAVVFLALGFVAWLIMDILHPTMGWFNRQMQAAAPLATVLSNFCSKIV
jgi:hypothetical protein